jgi:uncharacterized protein YjbI with pentapeptide repeats
MALRSWLPVRLIALLLVVVTCLIALPAIAADIPKGLKYADQFEPNAAAAMPDRPQTDFHNQDLRGSEFAKANLTGANFDNANLEGAVFSSSGIVNASFKGANMHQVFMDTIFIENTDLSNADLTDTMLLRAFFTNVNITGADFSGSILDKLENQKLCKVASGKNPRTGVETAESLGC